VQAASNCESLHSGVRAVERQSRLVGCGVLHAFPGPGIPKRRTDDYERHRTITLFGADIATVSVIATNNYAGMKFHLSPLPQFDVVEDSVATVANLERATHIF
jgi:hypothetical protein